jgi:hypothetical protein
MVAFDISQFYSGAKKITLRRQHGKAATSFDNYTSTNATFIVLDVKIKKEHPSIVQDVMVTDGKTIGFIYPELLTRIVAE